MLARRVGHVVEHDEVHALVVERVVRLAEELLVGLALVERRVVLAGHEAHVLHLEFADDVAEFRQALPALLGVVGGVREVAGEHDEVGLLLEAVDGGNGLFERPLGVGVGRSFEAPVRVGQLHEIEIVGGLRAARERIQARGEYRAAYACQFEEVAPVDAMFHGCLLVRGLYGLYAARPAGPRIYSRLPATGEAGIKQPATRYPIDWGKEIYAWKVTRRGVSRRWCCPISMRLTTSPAGLRAATRMRTTSSRKRSCAPSASSTACRAIRAARGCLRSCATRP